jgi:hypothetical protein
MPKPTGPPDINRHLLDPGTGKSLCGRISARQMKFRNPAESAVSATCKDCRLLAQPHESPEDRIARESKLHYASLADDIQEYCQLNKIRLHRTNVTDLLRKLRGQPCPSTSSAPFSISSLDLPETSTRSGEDREPS